MDAKINFIPLDCAHFPLITKWLNEPHVRKWWSIGFDKVITLKAVENKLSPRVTGIEAVKAFVIEINNILIGYIQVSDARKFARENYTLNMLNDLTTSEHLASIDLYIGEVEYLNKGYSAQILNQFLRAYVEPHYDACLVDPDFENKVAIACFKKVGFKELTTINLSNGRQAIIMLTNKARCG